jgi:hypothetical protein
MNKMYESYATIIQKPVRRITDVTRLMVCARKGSVITQTPLESTDFEEARAEAQAMFPDRQIVIPRLGETLPAPSHLRVIQ